MSTAAPIGVLLMTYGSAATTDDVPAYLRSIRHGSDAPAELIEEFQRRYRRIGYSPLLRITHAQAHALQERLDDLHGRNHHRVEVGMLHSEPAVAVGVDRLLTAGCRRIVGIVLAPQYSPIILAGYHRALEGAVEATGLDGVRATVAGPWHLEGDFVEALVQRVAEALAELPPALRDEIPVILTAHSLPRVVVERDPGYVDQLQETVAAVVQRLGIAPERWQFAYQSAGHTAQEWLRPDVKELLPELHQSGHRDVLIIPVQFVSDHLEILYDIDVAAAEEARSLEIQLHRIRLLNTSPAFIDALVSVVAREQRLHPEGLAAHLANC